MILENLPYRCEFCGERVASAYALIMANSDPSRETPNGMCGSCYGNAKKFAVYREEMSRKENKGKTWKFEYHEYVYDDELKALKMVGKFG